MCNVNNLKKCRVENSGDLYDAMSKLVEKTGGAKITTSHPKAIFEDSEKFLLLF